MDTKSDEGGPGELGDTRPLTEDERAMLDRLRDGAGTDVAGDPAEAAPRFGAAVDADAPVPGGPPGGSEEPDPLDPVFREPER